jgi:hypothetical protein
MTINLGLISGELFFRGLPVPDAGQECIIKLKGKYSNQYLKFNAAGDLDYLRASLIKGNDWFELTWADPDNIVQDLDVAGYYNLEVYNKAQNGRETFIRTELVKAINDNVITQVDYTSTDNENGEQVIYFRQ